MSSAKENTVRNLESVLSVLVGLALSTAVVRLLLDGQRQVDPQVFWGVLPMFLSFLVTMVPFYHGALRHLDVTYVEHGGKAARRPALLCDFAMFFVEGCLLVALANALDQPSVFAWGLIVLLGLDAVWGAAVHFVLVKDRTSPTELRWAKINALAVGFLLPFALTGRLSAAASWGNPLIYVALARTVLDYAWCWDCYFPRE